MLIEALRNIRRRRTRTFLTVLGIAIGIIALTVMGSLAEMINRMVEVQLEDARGIITVEPRFSLGPPGSGNISIESQEAINAMPEVNKVIPFTVSILGGIDGSEVQRGSLSGLVGFPPGETAERFRNVELESGGYLSGGETDTMLVGHQLADRYGLEVGDSANFRGYDFTVKGIFRPYEGFFINDSAVAPLETVQKVALLRPESVALQVAPVEGADIEVLAERIDTEIDDVSVTSPAAAEEQAQRSLIIFSAIVVGLAVISLVVGGVATINTMVMAISERTREIGLKKAVGAPDHAILLEYVTEATIIGLIAGIAGVVIGIVATVILNGVTESQFGLEIFRVTVRLSLFSTAFAAFLGAAAGLFPALRAARLDPVMALRAE